MGPSPVLDKQREARLTVSERQFLGFLPDPKKWFLL
jgi:hypothetical protein